MQRQRPSGNWAWTTTSFMHVQMDVCFTKVTTHCGDMSTLLEVMLDGGQQLYTGQGDSIFSSHTEAETDVAVTGACHHVDRL